MLGKMFPLILGECTIAFDSISRPEGTLYLPHSQRGYRFDPTLGHEPETGHMPHQPLSSVPSRTFQYLMATAFSEIEVQQSPEDTTEMPLDATL